MINKMMMVAGRFGIPPYHTFGINVDLRQKKERFIVTIVTNIVIVAARWTKSLKFTLSIAVHRGGLAKNHFWLVAAQKKRIGEQLSYF